MYISPDDVHAHLARRVAAEHRAVLAENDFTPRPRRRDGRTHARHPAASHQNVTSDFVLLHRKLRLSKVDGRLWKDFDNPRSTIDIRIS
jgi:hypothetical protein